MLKPLHPPVGGARGVAHDCTVNEHSVSQPRSLHVSATEVGVIWQVMMSTKAQTAMQALPELRVPELRVQVAQHTSKVLEVVHFHACCLFAATPAKLEVENAVLEVVHHKPLENPSCTGHAKNILTPTEGVTDQEGSSKVKGSTPKGKSTLSTKKPTPFPTPFHCAANGLPGMTRTHPSTSAREK